MDEKFDENSPPGDDSRALRAAERICTGKGWLDDGSPADFQLPRWCEKRGLSRYPSGEPSESLSGNDTEPLSRRYTLKWVRQREFWIWRKVEHQIEDDTLDGIIEAGKTGVSPSAGTGKASKTLPAQKPIDLSNYMDAANLTDLQRECFSLKYEYEWRTSDIERRLGIHRKTIGGHIKAAERRIKIARLRETSHARTARTNPERLNRE